MILACRKGGTISIPGVYGGLVDKFPLGAAFNKGLTFKMGQTHIQRFTKPLLAMIEQGKIDPTFIISHHIPLEHADRGYATFYQQQDDCTKVVLKTAFAPDRATAQEPALASAH
jgi:threonine dehydrogenase-like Zn-dependent dehydrogenase